MSQQHLWWVPVASDGFGQLRAHGDLDLLDTDRGHRIPVSSPRPGSARFALARLWEAAPTLNLGHRSLGELLELFGRLPLVGALNDAVGGPLSAEVRALLVRWVSDRRRDSGGDAGLEGAASAFGSGCDRVGCEMVRAAMVPLLSSERVAGDMFVRLCADGLEVAEAAEACVLLAAAALLTRSSAGLPVALVAGCGTPAVAGGWTRRRSVPFDERSPHGVG